MSTTTTEVILQQIGDWIAGLVSRVSEWLWANFQPVFDTIASWLDNVFGALSNTINRLKSFISEVYETIVSTVSSLVDDALGFLREIYDRVANSIASLFDSVTGYIADSFNALTEEILSIADTVRTWLTDAYDSIANAIKSIVEDVSTWLGTLFDDVKLAITTLIERAAVVVDAIVQGIKDFIASVIDTIGVGLKTLLEAASKIPEALSEMGAGFAASIEENIGKPLASLSTEVWEQLGDVMEKSWGVTTDVADAFRRPLMGRTQTAPQTRAEWDEFFRETMPKGGTAAALVNTFVGIFLLMRIGGGIADAQAQIVLQEFGEEYPYNIPQVEDVIRLKHFNIIDEGQAIPLIKKQGFSAEDAKRMIKIGETAPPEGEALAWWLRGIYTDEEITLALSKRGWNDRDQEAIKQASQIIPPVQDLITMAVREVFTPEVAERFGQFEDFPDAFKEWAAKLGLSEEWARNYWAAHWALPSPQMGFEMLHRRQIDANDLDLLLKSADVMPFWRDKIAAISYAPFTRVDIRRMHKVGVLSEEEVYEAYQDIGYNPEKARRLTDFTLELNKEKPVDDDIELVNLTRSNIIGFYEDGLLERAEAYSMLIGIGLSEDAASLYLMSVDMTEQRKERKDETSLILDQAKAGLITFEQGQDSLARLGLETRELAKAMTKLIRQQAQRTKLPSKGDLDKMLINEIINDDEYKETLHLTGYSEEWADRLHTLLKGA